MKSSNKYDYLLILLISILVFGYYGSPLYPSRLLALAISPFVLKELSRGRVYIPQYVKNFFLIWIVVGCISLLWSYDRANGVKAIFYYFCNIINFFSLYVFALKARRPIRSILVGWLLLFVLTLPIAIYEFRTGEHVFATLHTDTLSLLGDDGSRIQRKFASVTYGNLNKYNVVVCFCLPYVLASFLYFRDKKVHVLLWIVILAIIYVIMMNASRGAFLCLSLALAVFVAILLKQKVVNRLFVVIMCLLSVYVVYTNSEIFLGQIRNRLFESSIGGNDPRIDIYTRAINLLVDTYGIGVGIGGVNRALRSTTISGYAAMHNMFLEFLIQFGLIPFCFFISFVCKTYIGVWLNKNPFMRLLGTMLIVTVIPLFIINSNYLMDTDMWLFWGSAFAILMIYKQIVNVK